MYEHPYLAYRVTEFDQEQVAQAAERRRFLTEHADQIVPRAAGPMRRLIDRMLGRAGTRAAAAPRGAVDTGSGSHAVSASLRTVSDAAAGVERRVPAGCEAAPAR